MSYENKEISYSIRPEAFKTPRKFLDLNFETLRAIYLIATQSKNKENRKIARQLKDSLLEEGILGKITYFPPKTQEKVGLEVPFLVWTGALPDETLKVFLKAIFPEKNQEEVTKAIGEKREIFFKLRKKLEIPVNTANPYDSSIIKSIYNKFSERKQKEPIGEFAYNLSQSLLNKGKIEISRECLKPERNFRELLKIIFKESNDDKVCCQLVVDLLKKGRELTLDVRKRADRFI